MAVAKLRQPSCRTSPAGEFIGCPRRCFRTSVRPFHGPTYTHPLYEVPGSGKACSGRFSVGTEGTHAAKLVNPWTTVGGGRDAAFGSAVFLKFIPSRYSAGSAWFERENGGGGSVQRAIAGSATARARFDLAQTGTALDMAGVEACKPGRETREAAKEEGLSSPSDAAPGSGVGVCQP